MPSLARARNGCLWRLLRLGWVIDIGTCRQMFLQVAQSLLNQSAREIAMTAPMLTYVTEILRLRGKFVAISITPALGTQWRVQARGCSPPTHYRIHSHWMKQIGRMLHLYTTLYRSKLCPQLEVRTHRLAVPWSILAVQPLSLLCKARGNSKTPRRRTLPKVQKFS